MEYHACEVVEDAQRHDGKHEVEAHGVHTFDSLRREFPPCDEFDKREEDVATVEHGDGQEVHDGKNDADECRQIPEGIPIPSGREEASDSAE